MTLVHHEPDPFENSKLLRSLAHQRDALCRQHGVPPMSDVIDDRKRSNTLDQLEECLQLARVENRARVYTLKTLLERDKANTLNSANSNERETTWGELKAVIELPFATAPLPQDEVTRMVQGLCDLQRSCSGTGAPLPQSMSAELETIRTRFEALLDQRVAFPARIELVKLLREDDRLTKVFWSAVHRVSTNKGRQSSKEESEDVFFQTLHDIERVVIRNAHNWARRLDDPNDPTKQKVSKNQPSHTSESQPNRLAPTADADAMKTPDFPISRFDWRGWIYEHTRSIVADAQRKLSRSMKGKRRIEPELPESLSAKEDDGPLDKAVKSEQASNLHDAIAKLSQDEIKVLNCRYFRDMTLAETAKQLDMDINKVRRTEKEAEEKLRKLLGGDRALE